MSSNQKKDLATQNSPNSPSANVMEFRKTNEAIGLRVKEGKLSFLSRKLYNVMIYHAQQQGTPGKGAPIQSEAAKKFFWIPFAELARNASYCSNDTQTLKQLVDELQDLKIHIEDDTQWTSERLVSSVKLVNPAGLKARGGTVWFGFAFPPEVHELVMRPGTYTKLSIFYQGLLHSGTALALYEICRRYATNPSRVTSSEAYEYWYGALTGTPVRDDPPPYKYFKRDLLKRAIAEINSTTDIEISLIEHKNGRRIERLQFHVELNKQPALVFPAPPVIDSEMVEKIKRYGFTQQEASDLSARYTENELTASIAITDARLAAVNSPPLDSSAAYFRWSLKRGPAGAQAQLDRTRKPEQKPKEGPSVLDRFLHARGVDAIGIYEELNDSERRDVFARFREANQNSGIKLDRGIENPMVRSLFSQWYSAEMWGPPTAETLAAFVEQQVNRSGLVSA